MQKKVSIITPCYNGEMYVERMLNSVLEQDYNNIEFIFINDGSTDKTEAIVKKYETKFKKKGIDFIYIYQSNSGQAAALNKGLAIFKGDYLTWPDSDDMLSKDSISKKVEFLEKNPEYKAVRTDAAVVNENDITKIIGYLSKKSNNRFKEDLFLDFLLENDIWYAPGCFMIKREVFLKLFPDRKIIESRAGQNWQILLPVSLHYKWGYIDENLYVYVVRGNSHSHETEGQYEKILKKYNQQEELLNAIIDTLDIDQEKFHEIIKEKYLKKKLNDAYNFKNSKDFFTTYGTLKNLNKICFRDKMRMLRMKYRLFDKIVKLLRRKK